jgi:hypothetical protein
MKDFPKEIEDAKSYWEPASIATFRLARSGELGLKYHAEELQGLVRLLSLGDERDLAVELLGLIRAMVDRLNWLAEAGKLGNAPCFHETWPINYAPDAGKGASKWETVKKLYRNLGCGKDAKIPRRAGRVDYQNRWTALAYDGVRSALLAKEKAARVRETIKGATLKIHRCDEVRMKQGNFRAASLRTKGQERVGRMTIECDYYLFRDGHVIAWPAWAEKSRSLPDTLTGENWQEFLPVVGELVRIYLLPNEKARHEYFKASVPKKMEYVEQKEWDAFFFDNFLMKKVKGALKSLASRKR